MKNKTLNILIRIAMEGLEVEKFDFNTTMNKWASLRNRMSVLLNRACMQIGTNACMHCRHTENFMHACSACTHTGILIVCMEIGKCTQFIAF